jgi:ankyrin repeat protein
VVDLNGRTLLHEAASGNHLRALQFILKLQEVWHSQPDYYGNTALHEAATNGHADIVKQLLFAGCDASVQNSAGCVPACLCGVGSAARIRVLG